jgi:hypothetical protein
MVFNSVFLTYLETLSYLQVGRSVFRTYYTSSIICSERMLKFVF